MENTQISDLGSRKIAVGPMSGEITIPALGNGIAKPGEAVGITDATGKVVGCDIGASEMFRGLLANDYKTADNVAIPDGSPCHVIIPQSGHRYRTWITDPAGAVVSGLAHAMSATAGNFVGAANTNLNTAGSMCINTHALANNDRVADIGWL